MRILHLVSYSIFSGPLPSTLGLALAQKAAGHEVYLAHDQKRGALNDFEEAADEHLAAAKLAPPISLTLSSKSSLGQILADRRALKHLCKNQHINILHLHMSHDHVLASLSLPRRLRPISVRTIHADRSLQPRFGQRLLTRRADGWIVRTNEHQILLRDRFSLDSHRIERIVGGINHDHFKSLPQEQKAAAKQRFNLDPDKPVLGQVALIDNRGQEELLNAFAHLDHPDLQLLFVGRGEQEEALEAKIKEKNLAQRVKMAGYVPWKELPEVYAAMDAAFIAQVGNDASGRAALEAMACGLPTLAIQRGAFYETVNEARGFPIPDGQTESIAFAIKYCLDNPEKAAEVSAEAMRYIEGERTFAREAADTLKFYETLQT